jgi:hypothetical protein
MPPVLLTNGMVLQMRVWASDSVQASVNTFHYLVQSPITGTPTDQDFFTKWAQDFVPLYKSLLSAKATIEGCTGQVVSKPIGLLFKDATQAGLGSFGPDAAPWQVSGITSWGTAFGGRAFRGRTYFPFVATLAVNTAGHPSDAYITAMGLFSDAFVGATSWILAQGTAVIIPVIKHRKNKDGITPIETPIVHGTVSRLFATQKRRGDYGRPNISPFG